MNENERRRAMLRAAFPDPMKRAIWLFGAIGASMNGFATASQRATESMRALIAAHEGEQ